MARCETEHTPGNHRLVAGRKNTTARTRFSGMDQVRHRIRQQSKSIPRFEDHREDTIQDRRDMNKRAKRRLGSPCGSPRFGSPADASSPYSFRSGTSSVVLPQPRSREWRRTKVGDYEAALTPLSFALANDRNDIALALALADTRIRNTDENGRYLFASEKYYTFALTLDPDE